MLVLIWFIKNLVKFFVIILTYVFIGEDNHTRFYIMTQHFKELKIKEGWEYHSRKKSESSKSCINKYQDHTYQVVQMKKKKKKKKKFL